jgi:hypothetical protein
VESPDFSGTTSMIFTGDPDSVLSPGRSPGWGCFDLRYAATTASVHSGTRSTPGTSLPSRDGINSQCQPTRPVSATATTTSKISSRGDMAPSTNSGKPIHCTTSAMTATSKAALKRERCESKYRSKDITSTAGVQVSRYWHGRRYQMHPTFPGYLPPIGGGKRGPRAGNRPPAEQHHGDGNHNQGGGNRGRGGGNRDGHDKDNHR